MRWLLSFKLINFNVHYSLHTVMNHYHRIRTIFIPHIISLTTNLRTFRVGILVINGLHCPTEVEFHILLHQPSVKGAQVHVLVKYGEVCDLVLWQFSDVSSIAVLLTSQK